MKIRLEHNSIIKNINSFKHHITSINPTSKKVKTACLMGLMALSSLNIACSNVNKKTNSQNFTQVSYENRATKDFTLKYGKYGKYYLNNIPDKENTQRHIELLSELAGLCKENQGCEFSNPAVLNGLTCEELKTKVLTPARNIAQNIPFGENQKTLALIGFERGLDDKKAFEKDFQNKNMTQKNGILGDGTPIKFDKSFFSNYDNIIIIQPQKQSCDKTLDTIFAKIKNTMQEGTAFDIAVMGHGLETKDGMILSFGRDENATLDASDFKDVKNGGNSYTEDIKEIFKNSIDNGYSPRFIGLGCNTDFLQDCIDKKMGKDSYNVKIFGTPTEVMDSFLIGFVNDSLNMFTLTDSIKYDIGMAINITDEHRLKSDDNNKEVETFTFDKKMTDDVIKDFTYNNVTYGTLSKPNDVIMEYNLILLK